MKKFLLFIFLCITANSWIQAQSLNLDWVSPISGYGGSIFTSAIVTNKANYVYAVGRFQDSIEVSSITGLIKMKGIGKEDLFIAKMNLSGDILWLKQIGGSNATLGTSHEQDWGLNPYFSMVIDEDTNLYIGGNFTNTVDFDPGTNSLLKTGFSHENSFILKLDKDGQLLWVKTFVGAANSVASIAIDTIQNEIAVTGFFKDRVDFSEDKGKGILTSLNPNMRDVFVAKYDTNGGFIWVKQMGGSKGSITNTNKHNEGLGIHISPTGFIYTTGIFYDSADFDPGPGTAYLSSTAWPAQNIFVSKLDKDGNYVWAKAMGALSNHGSRGSAIVADQQSNVYTTGFYQGTASFDPTNHTTISSTGQLSCFISKLDSMGEFVWVKKFDRPVGKQGVEHGKSIKVDENDHVYVTGYFSNEIYLDPDPLHTSREIFKPGSSTANGFMVKLTSAGDFLWGRHVTSNKQNRGLTCHVASSKQVFIGGFFTGTSDFNPLGPSFPLSALNVGVYPDGYVMKLSCMDTSIVNLDVETCNKVYELNGITYKKSGIYRQVLNNNKGCDSIVMLNLVINAIEKPIINVQAFELSTVLSYQTYQWFYNGNILTGETNRTLQVNQNGDYRVAVTSENGCSDTSDSYKVTNVTGIQNEEQDIRITIFPNPTNDLIYIRTEVQVNALLSHIDGRKIKFLNKVNQISTQELTTGMYLLKIFDMQGNILKVEKIIKM